MIILDLNSEAGPIWPQTNFYFGKPFIWCLLHNYGGTRGIYGNLDTVATGPISAKQTPGTTMIGTGMTPEAIEHNPVIYDLMVRIIHFLFGMSNQPSVCLFVYVIILFYITSW